MDLINLLFYRLPTIFLLQLLLALLTLSVLLLVFYSVLKYKAIHANCRTFLLISAFGFTLVTTTHLTKITPFVLRGDFMPTVQPTTILHILSGLIHVFGYLLTSSSECAIVIERVIACKYQRSYDRHGLSYKFMIPAVIGIFTFSTTLTYLAMIRGYGMACVIFAQCMDYTTVGLAFLCNRYCRRRYRNLLASTLSAKYQIREVSSLTAALVPITFFSAIIKLCIAAELWCEFLFRERWPYMVVVSAYQTFHTLIATLWCSLLLTRHRGLHHRSLLLLRRLLPRRLNPTPVLPPRRLPEIDFAGNSAHTNAYFDMLKSDWK